MGRFKSSSTGDLRHWQVRIFSTVWITYFAFYLCRYNMPMVTGEMGDAFSWDKSQMGIIFSSLLLMYAVGQFVNGQLADRFGSRLIASLGVLGSVSMNMAVFLVTLCFSPETANPRTILLLVAVFWGANGFFQAMGWTPMVRIMAHWFSSENRGKVMGFMGTCYQFGAAFSWFLAFFIVTYYVQQMGGDWRAAFWVPAGLFAIVGVVFFTCIRNTPEDAGLPEVEPDDHCETGLVGESQRTIVQNIARTLRNPYIWIVALTFFFLDVNRYGFVNWLPDFLAESGESIGVGGFGFKEVMKRIIHPLAGSAGAVAAGWATDRFFNGRRAPVIALLLTLLGLCSIVFPYLDPGNTALVIFILAAIGFCTYGPHILMVGHAAQDFGKKAGAAGAAGFIDGMGYVGASLAGWGAGELIDRYGHEFTFVLCGLAAILGAILVCLIWRAGPRTHTVN
ncbi:MAG: MFS transporter [Phycisphaerales bacterium]|nr:MAG: MFS transporter [Phycisphaerales bacterium]